MGGVISTMFTSSSVAPVTSKTVLQESSLIRSDVNYKYYTQRYGTKGVQRIRFWNNKTAASTDATFLRRKGYKVNLSGDGRAVIVLGKTTRGFTKTSTGTRASQLPSSRRSSVAKSLPRKKPYTPSGYRTFRQPSKTLQKHGWSR